MSETITESTVATTEKSFCETCKCSYYTTFTKRHLNTKKHMRNVTGEIKIKIPDPSKDPEYVKQYNKQRYIKNRQVLLDDAMIRKHCDLCDCDYFKCHEMRHFKTSKHLKKLEIKNNIDLEKKK